MDAIMFSTWAVIETVISKVDIVVFTNISFLGNNNG